MRIGDEAFEQACALHRDNPIVAAHTDICPDVAKRQASGERSVFTRRHLPTLRSGGISAICDHVAGDAPYHIDNPFRNTLAANRLKFGMQGLAAMRKEVRLASEHLVIAKTVDDIQKAKSDGRLAIILCFEGAGPVEDDLELLSLYWDLGVRAIGLTHDSRNLLGDGVRSGSNGRLTTFGRDAVREMNRLGIAVDVSHLNEPGFWDTIDTSSAPVYASHSNARAIYDVSRNLTDSQLTAIAEAGGVVGLHALGGLIGAGEARPRLERLLEHLGHMLEIVGEDHLAIGPDILERGQADDYERLWQDHAYVAGLAFRYPEEFDSLSKLTSLTAALLQQGYEAETVLKILGGNLLAYFERVWL